MRISCWRSDVGAADRHHGSAIPAGPADCYNHVNFMVSDIDDVGRAINRMKAANVPIVFGPGRHEPSGSIFLYFLDPDGMTAEYSFGMEELDEVGARAPRNRKSTSPNSSHKCATRMPYPA